MMQTLNTLHRIHPQPVSSIRIDLFQPAIDNEYVDDDVFSDPEVPSTKYP